MSDVIDVATGEAVGRCWPMAIDRDCPRCGGVHLEAAFQPLANPQDEYGLYAMCPATNQPVLAATFAGAGGSWSLTELLDDWRRLKGLYEPEPK